MEKLKFSKEEKQQIVRQVQLYFREELDQELGVYFYNRGLYDAQALVAGKVEELAEAIFELERPATFRK